MEQNEKDALKKKMKEQIKVNREIELLFLALRKEIGNNFYILEKLYSIKE